MKYHQFTNRRIGYKVTVAILALLISSVTLSSRSTSGPNMSAPILSDEQLFEYGYNGYQSNDYVTATVYLYAYIQRNPQALTDATWSSEIEAAFTHSWNLVSDAFKRDREAQEAARRQPVGTNMERTTKGIEVKPNLTKPPVLARPPAANAKRCDMYATIAVAQNELNIKHACGLFGPRWSSDFDYHLNWCLPLTDNVVDSQTVERQKLLNECAFKPSRANIRNTRVKP